MGIAIADIAASYGAEVDLVLGPVSILPEEGSVIVTNVTTAREMAEECKVEICQLRHCNPFSSGC